MKRRRRKLPPAQAVAKVRPVLEALVAGAPGADAAARDLLRWLGAEPPAPDPTCPVRFDLRMPLVMRRALAARARALGLDEAALVRLLIGVGLGVDPWLAEGLAALTGRTVVD